MPNILSLVMNSVGIKITFRSNNKPLNILKPKIYTPIPTEEKPGIYKLICDDCNRFYISQTGFRSNLKRFHEHTPKKITSVDNINCNYSRHFVTHNHDYADFNSNLVPLNACKKGPVLNAL